MQAVERLSERHAFTYESAHLRPLARSLAMGDHKVSSLTAASLLWGLHADEPPVRHGTSHCSGVYAILAGYAHHLSGLSRAACRA